MTGYLLGFTFPPAAANNPVYSIKDVIILRIMNS